GTEFLTAALPAERDNLTALIERSREGTVPAGTRRAVVTLVAERVSGNSNDGYADNLHFAVEEVEAPPPPPPPPPGPPPDPALTRVEGPLVVQTLEPGWNLVGWSGATGGRDAFNFISGPFTTGFTFDAGSKRFASFSPGAPELLNSLDRVAFGDGIWILAPEESTWIQPAPWWARDVSLQAGFNLTLWTGPNQTPIAEAVASLGSALRSVFVWDVAQQGFLSYRPDAPDFLNTASTINYGDGVWIDVARPVEWAQPALPRVGTQDIWFIRNIARLDADGNKLESLMNAFLSLAEGDLGPPIRLQFGMVFQEAPRLTARILAENGVQIPNIDVQVGLVTRDLSVAQVIDDPADVFMGDNFLSLVMVASPRLDEALYTIDLSDFFSLDLTDVAQIEVGDVLAFEYVFAQALESEFPLAYGGLSNAAVMAERWNRGDLQILAGRGQDGTLQVAVNESAVYAVEGSTDARGAAKESIVMLRAEQLGVGAEAADFLAGILADYGASDAVDIDHLRDLIGGGAAAGLASFLGDEGDVALDNLPSAQPPAQPPTVLSRGFAATCPTGIRSAQVPADTAAKCETVSPGAPPKAQDPPSPPTDTSVPPAERTLSAFNFEVPAGADLPAALPRAFFTRATDVLGIGQEGLWEVELEGAFGGERITAVMTASDIKPPSLPPTLPAPTITPVDGVSNRWLIAWVPREGHDALLRVKVGDARALLRTVRVGIPELGVTISGRPGVMGVGQRETITVTITGGEPPYEVSVFDNQADFATFLVSNEATVPVEIFFKREGPHLLSAEVFDSGDELEPPEPRARGFFQGIPGQEIQVGSETGERLVVPTDLGSNLINNPGAEARPSG
ncbi:MAG: hypothetical protein O6913_09870, partial [Chloroflexi bacterium]|nr:hypothetical protein [Chloroflexota bacterium]